MVSTTGLVAYYAIDETSGTTMTDSHSSSYDGTYNGVTVNQTGLIDKAAYFDGTNDYAPVGFTGFSTSDITTVSLWFKTSTNQTNDSIFTVRYTTGGDCDRGVRFTSGAINVNRYDASDAGFSYSMTYSDGSWHHLVYMETTGGAELWIDGTQVATSGTAKSFSILSSKTLEFGVRNDNGSRSAYGEFTLDEVSIWSRELSSDDIADLYNSGSGLAYPLTSDTTVPLTALGISTTENEPTIIATEAVSGPQNVNVAALDPAVQAGATLGIVAQSVSITAIDPNVSIGTENPTFVTVGTGGVSTRFINTDWPITEGLELGTTKLHGRKTQLVPKKSNVLRRDKELL